MKVGEASGAGLEHDGPVNATATRFVPKLLEE